MDYLIENGKEANQLINSQSGQQFIDQVTSQMQQIMESKNQLLQQNQKLKVTKAENDKILDQLNNEANAVVLEMEKNKIIISTNNQLFLEKQHQLNENNIIINSQQQQQQKLQQQVLEKKHVDLSNSNAQNQSIIENIALQLTTKAKQLIKLQSRSQELGQFNNQFIVIVCSLAFVFLLLGILASKL